ncbi:MAG: ABC transporter permease subunit [Alphaproteobacteria bacterium]|nr:ABC transporter permease subunit [Alphaproteobacteria bacterium]
MTAIVPPQPKAGPILPLKRDKSTKASVLLTDKIADWTITIGGLFVILAVAGIMVFLVQVVVPLFTGAELKSRTEFTLPPASAPSLAHQIDEFHTVLAEIGSDGAVKLSHVGTGKSLGGLDPLFDQPATAYGASFDGEDMIFGFADGTVRFARLRLSSLILPESDLPDGLTQLNERDLTDGKIVYSKVPGHQIRKTSFSFSAEEPQAVAPPGIGVVDIDYRVGGTDERPVKAFVVRDTQGVVHLNLAETRTNMMTQKTTTDVTEVSLPGLPQGFVTASLLVNDRGDQVYVAGEDGTVYRYDARDIRSPVLAETFDLVSGQAKLTGLSYLIGEQSLVVTDDQGSVDVFFRLPAIERGGSDNFTLVKTHELEKQKSAIVALVPSQRNKMFLSADKEGHLWLRHSTSEQTLLKLSLPEGSAPLAGLTMAPRADGVLAITEDRKAILWRFDAPHPETTFGSLFGKVWYEGYEEPSYTWQSSSGTDSFEPKLSLVPLIFGTFKATVYSLLFAVPIALLGAIYTSEFVHFKVRAVVKPGMEMMASLPSVVLGFIAALVLAPIVETWLAAVFLGFIVVPLSLLVAAYLWQLVPGPVVRRLGGVAKFLFIFVVLGIGFELAFLLSGPFEDLFFAGDMKLWANGTIGSDAPFLTLIVWPLSYFLLEALLARVEEAGILRLSPHGNDLKAGLQSMARWLGVAAVSGLLAWALASLLSGVGVGARGGVIDTYVQRNTLIVGFAMGFAVIPLIYTLAEDALNSVPEHLRAASLACGATPWQTAISVILPAAVSGVFAAVMVGMGRAVGETMIVVMAAGNTALIDWNIFNGLRALSANIAVELPEAVKDDTLYRVLFLAALTLFAMTFIVNTLAEVIRQRFRKKSVAL